MPRPNKLRVETETYNCILPASDLAALRRLAHQRSVAESRIVSVADLIREAIAELLRA